MDFIVYENSLTMDELTQYFFLLVT